MIFVLGLPSCCEPLVENLCDFSLGQRSTSVAKKTILILSYRTSCLITLLWFLVIFIFHLFLSGPPEEQKFFYSSKIVEMMRTRSKTRQEEDQAHRRKGALCRKITYILILQARIKVFISFSLQFLNFSFDVELQSPNSEILSLFHLSPSIVVKTSQPCPYEIYVLITAGNECKTRINKKK